MRSHPSGLFNPTVRQPVSRKCYNFHFVFRANFQRSVLVVRYSNICFSGYCKRRYNARCAYDYGQTYVENALGVVGVRNEICAGKAGGKSYYMTHDEAIRLSNCLFCNNLDVVVLTVG